MTDEPILVPHLDEIEGAAGLEEAAADLYPKVLESICGTTDDSQPVEQYDGTLGVTRAFVDTNQPMVAQVQWNATLPYNNPGNVAGVRWGTGTMISADLFLTAGHLFDQTGGGWDRPRVNGTTNVISPQDIATNMHLNFNYQVDPQGTLRQEQSFAITQLVEYRLGGIDFAICRIGGNPGNQFGFATVATADAAVGDMLAIIGHPAGVPKRIEAGPLVDFDGDHVRYDDIDTLGGNSGSGILQAPSGQLVGVHTNGGCNASGTGLNYGQRIASVRAASPTLRSLSTPTSAIADRVFTSLQDDALPTTGILADILGHTGVVADVVGTTVSRDVLHTSKLRDDLRTDPVRDFGPVGTALGADVIPDPIGPVVDPAALARPFVLATPHHAAAGGVETPSQSEYLEALSRLEAVIAQQESGLTSLTEEYAALRAEYEERFGA